MSDTIHRAAFTIAICVVMANTMLFIGGFIPADTVPTISRILVGVDIDDFQSQDFQDSLLLKDSDGKNLADTSGDSFAVTVLDFIESIPLVGNIITFFRLVYELIFTMAFGIVIVASLIGLPGVVVIPLGVLFLLIYAVALLKLLQDFQIARGGRL